MRVCENCGSKEFMVKYPSIRREICSDGYSFKCETRNDIKVLECKKCGLLQLNKVISSINEFYHNSGMFEYNSISLQTLRREGHKDYMRQCNDICDFVRDKKVLDFGCGCGGVLSIIKNVAAEVCGVELDDNLRCALNNEGITCYENIDRLGKYDFISMFHVLAHIDKPIELLKNMSEHLCDDGIIYIETPNANDALLTLYSNEVFGSFTHHKDIIYYFTVDTLSEICNKAGYVSEVYLTQRFPLANHLYWLSNNKPGGQKIWTHMVDKKLDRAYADVLIKNGIADTIIAVLRKNENLLT